MSSLYAENKLLYSFSCLYLIPRPIEARNSQENPGSRRAADERGHRGPRGRLGKGRGRMRLDPRAV